MSLAIADAAMPTKTSGEEIVHVSLLDEDWLLADALMTFPEDRRMPIRITSFAATLEEGLSIVRQQRPQIVVASPELFIEGFRSLGDEIPVRTGKTRLAVFGDRLSDSRLAQAVSSGISGVLSKRCSRAALLEGLERIAQGEFFVAQPIAGRVRISEAGGPPSVPDYERLATLTRRQLEVLVHLASGDTIKEIANRMHLSEKSIESHKFRLMKRLGLSTRMQLCRWAIREGLVTA